MCRKAWLSSSMRPVAVMLHLNPKWLERKVPKWEFDVIGSWGTEV